MIFHMTADCTFEANNIDHAFRLLSEHFETLEFDDIGMSPLKILSGEIKIKPQGDKGTETSTQADCDLLFRLACHHLADCGPVDEWGYETGLSEEGWMDFFREKAKEA